MFHPARHRDVPVVRDRIMQSNKLSERGAALIYVLIAVAAMLGMMGVVFAQLSEVRTAIGTWEWTRKARAAAESAIEVAQLKLMDDPAWKVGEDTVPEYDVALTDAQARVKTERVRFPDLVKLTAVGRYRGGRGRIERTAQITDPTLFALIAQKRIELEFGTGLWGTASAGEGITIARGVSFKSVTDVPTLISGKDVTYDVAYPEVRTYESAGSLPTDALNLDDLKKTYETRIADGTLADIKLAARRLLRDGSLTIVNGEYSDVSLFVAGDLRMTGSPKFSSKGDTPIIIVEKDFTATFSGAEISGVIYVAGKVTLRGQATITGTIIADEIDVADGVTIQSFQEDPVTKPPPRSFFKREIRWIDNSTEGRRK